MEKSGVEGIGYEGIGDSDAQTNADIARVFHSD